MNIGTVSDMLSQDNDRHSHDQVSIDILGLLVEVRTFGNIGLHIGLREQVNELRGFIVNRLPVRAAFSKVICKVPMLPDGAESMDWLLRCGISHPIAFLSASLE